MLITMRPNSVPIDDAAVVFKHGVILAAGPSSRVIKSYPGHSILRLQNAVLMPGLVNLHAHLELPPLLDSIRAGSFPEWVLNLIQAKRNLNKSDYQAAIHRNIKALMQSGTATVGEICSHGESPSFLRQSGLRGTVFHEIISMNPLAPSPLRTPLLSRFSSLVAAGISPHTPYTVSEAVLMQVKDRARLRNLKLAMHVAESDDESRLLRKRKSGLEKLYQFANWDLAWAPSGGSPFDYLDRIGFLGPDLLAVHAVRVTDKDIGLIKKSRVSIAHCPRSNKELGVGRMPLRKFLDSGITVGLGTDSLASVPSLNMWDEMRYAYRVHRRDGIRAEDIFHLATIGGAKALGLGGDIGSLESGKKADIIAVPLPGKNTGDIYSDLLRETKSCIMSVVDGKIVYHQSDYAACHSRESGNPLAFLKAKFKMDSR
jgi:aminodeoxyfutalosine deaminase